MKLSVLFRKTGSKIPYFSVVLSALCLLTVLCFLFPEYLTTPEIRSQYPIDLFRKLLYGSVILSTATAFFSLVLMERKGLALISLALQLSVLLLGGSQVPLKENYDSFPVYLGLDWLVLNLFVLALLFVPLEGFFPRRKNQKIVRPEFKTDLTYFVIGHLGIQALLLLTQKPVDFWMEHFRLGEQSAFLSTLPVPVQILLALFVADLAQYFIHRGFHGSKILWRFHKIHHSIHTMDWLAGSRLHLVDIVVVRSLVYLTVMYLGLSTEAVIGYALIVGFHTVLIHCNFGIDFGSLKYVIVTPQYHHWHHHDQPETYDKNFAVHFPFIDRIFGTFYLPGKKWPTRYGIDEEGYPKSYWKQFLYPFQ